MDSLHDEMTAWLGEVLRRTGMTPYSLAKKAGVAVSTITRGLDPNSKHTISSPTIAKIRNAIGDMAPSSPTVPIPSQAPGFHDPGNDAYAISINETGDLRVDDAVRFLCASDPALVPWRLATSALEIAGYLPGDIAIVDLNAAPVDGDAVVAQHYHGASATTLFRLYQKPYLVAASADRIIRRPQLVDDMNVAIKGVVVASFRPRRGHIAAQA